MAMTSLFKKMFLYFLLILILLELLVRIFHLHNDRPQFYLDEDKTYKRVPFQKGFSVHGNRRQNFAEYSINSSGYNSYREFAPTEEGVEVAILGSSFIEGLHQDYFNSTGKKIEKELNHIKIYEYGHITFDLADQLYLLYSNKEVFDLVNYTILELKYPRDLLRDEYKVTERKVVFPILRHSKLLVYMLDIGMIDPLKEVLRKYNIGQKPIILNKNDLKSHNLYLENFKTLISKYNLDKSKTAFLLDSREIDPLFLEYLKEKNINYIDFGLPFEHAGDKPTTLIYDRHWNNYGRILVANEIVKYLSKKF